MRRVIVVLIVLIPSIGLFAQNSLDSTFAKPSNSIYLNAVGGGAYFSIHYERLSGIKSGVIISYNIGIGIGDGGDINDYSLSLDEYVPSKPWISIPHQVTANFKFLGEFIEVGLGGALMRSQNWDTHEYTYPYLSYLIFGLRDLPLKLPRLNARLYGILPITGANDVTILIPIGLSLGISF